MSKTVKLNFKGETKEPSIIREVSEVQTVTKEYTNFEGETITGEVLIIKGIADSMQDFGVVAHEYFPASDFEIIEENKEEITEMINKIKSMKSLSDNEINVFMPYIMNQIPDKYENYCKRQSYFTSSTIIEYADFDIYNEGLYIHFSGCQNGMTVFINNNGQVIRKPRNITKLNTKWFRLDY